MTAEAGSERERVARRRLTRKEAQAETRRRVLDAAAEVFGERGFRAASLSDVADRAGYTIGAVYSNFASKDALFHELMEGRLRQVEAALAADGPAGERSRATIDERIEAELDRLQAAEDAVPRDGGGSWRSSERSRRPTPTPGPTSRTPSGDAGRSSPGASRGSRTTSTSACR